MKEAAPLSWQSRGHLVGTEEHITEKPGHTGLKKRNKTSFTIR